MTTSPPTPPALTGTLSLYQPKPIALPYFDTDPTLPHSLVFLPGLTDTIGTLPYLPRLAASLARQSFSLVCPQLTANLGGYGQCTLEGDAQEIGACVSHLRTLASKRHGKVVLMGHSTGCQEVIAYLLSSNRACGERTRIDGGILQAPVSDREFYEMQRKQASEEERQQMDQELSQATQLVERGAGAALMPRRDADKISLPTDPDSTPQQAAGNTSAVLQPATTAYRTWSLKAKGGHDDFFSSDLPDHQITSSHFGARSIGRAVKNLQDGAASGANARLLALIGEKE